MPWQIDERLEAPRRIRSAIVRALALAAIVAALFPQAALSDTRVDWPSAERLAAFEAVVREQMAIDKSTGLALAFQIGDSVWARGFGFADVENRVPMTPEASFRLASVTKPMTACAIMQLVERGKIDLDAEIQTYVPYFPRKQWPVTVGQLLGHLGGITHYKNRDVELHIKEHKNTREALAIFQDYDLVGEPGTRYSYSTYGYNLLGAAIEEASGRSFGDYMRDSVWAPLAMKDTRMDDPIAIIPNRVRGYRIDGKRLVHSEFVDVSSRFAGGGTRGTVLDLLRFARGYQEGRIVSRSSMDRMATAGSTREGRATYYGLGWDVLPVNGHYMTSHSGGQNETRTLLFSIPEYRCAIAAATNFESADLYVYVQRLAQMALGELWDRDGGTATYGGDRVSGLRLAAMRHAFGYGLFEYEKRGRPLTEDRQELARAFRYLAGCLDRKVFASDRAAALERIEAGRHRANGEATSVVGAFIASRLAERWGPERLDDYHRIGAVPFFHDYVRLYRSTPDFPRELRFSAEVEKLLERWSRDWERTCTAETRRLVVAPSSNLDSLDHVLRRRFAGASIYPDFSQALATATMQLVGAGAPDRGLRAATLSHALYAEHPSTSTYLAMATLCTGDTTRARSLLRKAVAFGDEEVTGPGALRNRGYDLYHLGQPQASVELLKIATELYPREASLHESLGDICRAVGRKEESIAAFRRALEIDPTLEDARKAVEASSTQTAR